MDPSLSDIKTSGPIDEILESRYGGEGRRQFVERHRIRETYLAIDARLATGEYLGFFYHDLDGSPMLDAGQTTLTIPFRDRYLVIRGHRLLPLYRSVLHHSLDIAEATPHADLAARQSRQPVIAAVEVRRKGGDA